ncbi:hypothetical protein PFNF135_01823 [Plasmodium falciparum NF135/5.C10]|uniref:Erythrocyte membrane protein 1 n=1 Tax=Plasmodium falciparum NF135/5.C10 TaxID=1036726 RepID=W4ILI1_PLAFA|nr:hypothetical protein PFNF135_01823 [Plasmodium falciparum NF135/5.C10]
MAPGLGARSNKSAKEVFDEIGGIIQQQAKYDAEDFEKALKGILSKVELSNNGKVYTEDACLLNYTKDTNVTSGGGKENPCYGRQGVRFSDTNGAECYRTRIKGSNRISGSCAPFRRLHMCDRNLEEIKPHQITSTHNLLLDVLLAAKHEGEMITKNLKEYDNANYESKICTALARSFADIGDIVRGKDLFLNQSSTGGSPSPSSVTSPRTPVPPKTDSENPESWWDKNVESIWNGMICALTYNTDTQSGTAPQQDPTVKSALWDDTKNKPKKTDNGHDYTYGGVTLKDENSGTQGPKSNDNPTLEEFSKRPTFFRWLHEWGSDFCGKRKRMLKDVKDNCRNSEQEGKRHCSGDGHICDKTYLQHNDMFTDIYCPDCYEQCRKYRKWIDIKFEEYNNQKNKYGEEHGKIKANSSGDKNCCKDIEKHTSAADFLKELKHCKDDQTDGEQGNQEDKDNKIDFENIPQTFSRSTYCKTCPLNGVTCNGRRNNPCSENGEKWEGGFDKIPKKNGTCTDITVEMIDRRGPFIKEYLKKSGNSSDSLFKTSRLFKGIRKEQWECRYKDENMDICKLTNFNNEIDLNQYTTFKVFLEYWLENFLYGYYILKKKKKIDLCTKNEGNTCNEESKNDCVCVKKWVEKKTTEWEQIKEHFNNRKPDDDKTYTIEYKVRTFFEKVPFDSDMKKAIEPSTTLEQFKASLGCNDSDLSKKSTTGTQKDIIECILKDLQKKIDTCKTQPGETETNCDENSPLVEEEINPIDEDTDTTTTTDKQSPAFCKDIQPPEEPKEDSDRLCDDKKELKCNDLKIDMNTTYKPKIKLIGLGAHNLIARTNSNVYMSPRVRQLCLEQLTKLAVPTKNADLVTEEQFSEALQECAYNEAKSLYEYYKGEGKGMIPIKDNEKIEDKIKEHILEAMKRSYADYGNIVKGDMWWIYPDEKDVDTVIISVANKFNVNHKSSVSIDDDAKRLNLWKSLRNDIWKAMLCGYKKAGGCMKNLPNGGEFCTLPSTDKDNQFLRWFVEWGENFCIRREQELKQLKDKCKNGICKITDEGEIQECKSLCERYKEFLKNFESQYEKQRILYIELKESISEFKNKDPFTFLKEKCNPQFSCFKDINENESNKIFQHASDEIIKFCTCTSEDTSKSIPSNCIDKAAYELQKEATNKLGNASNSLKGNQNNISFKDCRRGDYVVVDNGVDGKKIDKDKLEIEFPSNSYSCEPNEINSFHIGKAWDCNNTNINIREKYLCLPPRRRFMCMKKLERISAKDVKDKKKLLQEVMEIAKEEGIRILKNYQEQNKTQFSEICDDMKYSFADLGDIIRGRDLWKKYRGERRLQQKLETIFNKIYNNLENGKQIYTYDYPYYHNLRNDWWEANRKDIWKAMTCSAPKKAYIYETTENSEKKIRSTNMYNYCGHNHNPPYDDYIPQRLRWMKEWGEYVCKILNDKINNMKNDCEQCTLNNSRCRDDDDGNKCRKCKSKCKEYTELIQNLKLQFSIQKQKYNELYTKIQNNRSGFTNDNDKNAIEFFEKVKMINKCDVGTPDKYLDKASHCNHYNFTQDKIKTTPYAFNDQPEKYKNHCVCKITNHPLDKCPFRNDNKSLCNILKEFSECKNKTFDNKLHTWGTHDLKLRTSINQGVFIPPRRTYLCLKPLIKKKYAQHEEHIFLNDFLTAAYTEAYVLGEKFKDQPTDALQAIKWSFADYGDIIKGTDMIDNMYLNDMKTQLETILKYNGTSNNTMSFKDWWEYNKDKVWHAMLCGYNKAGGIINHFDCNIPSEENTDQFLRWFQEWTEAFCSRRNELHKELEAQYKNAKCLDGRIYPDAFKNACEKYRNFIANKKIQYDLQMYQYNKKYNNSQINSKKKPDFIDKKCNGKCDCLFGKFIENSKLDNPYETLNNDELKEKCDCQKSERTPHLPLPADEPFDPTILQTTIPFGVALALGSIAFFFMKKKTHAPLDLFSVIDIPKSDYDIPTLKSKNRYIPYKSAQYKGKTYIYMEGDSSGEEKYAFMSDTTDVTSSESEYEELDINDIYVPHAPKYKTLIEVVLEPSGNNTPSDTQNDIQNDGIPSSKITDNEWNQLKHEFISQYLQSEQPNDVSNDYSSGDIPMNTEPNTLYFNKPEEKPFITSIHDRNLYSGEEYNYNVNMSTNSMDDPKYVSNNVYSGIDLINDTLSGNHNVDIYDELLKRKENELFGTNHVKQTSIHSVAKLARGDPLLNQLELFHKWLDRHRDMCEQWNNKEKVLDKLKEEWNKDNNSGDIHTSDSNKTLNTDVSIQIHMDNPKPKNEFKNMDTTPNKSTMDTMLDDLEKYNEPYYYDFYKNDIYYDVNDDDKTSMDNNNNLVDKNNPVDSNNSTYNHRNPADINKTFVDINNHNQHPIEKPTKIQIEMNSNNREVVEQQYPIADIWNI